MHRLKLVFLTIMALLVLTGCQSALQERSTTDSSSVPQDVGSYLEFEDVLIPKDLKVVEKESFVFETPHFKAGIVTYSGRVDPLSLANFFEKEMINDNWKLRSKVKYSRTILVFEKPDRDCIIHMSDSTFSTNVGVIVAPRQDILNRPAAFPQNPVEEGLPQ